MGGYSRLLPGRSSDAPLFGTRSNLKGKSASVTVHIYDVSHSKAVKTVNNALSKVGTGAFHAGVAVYGREWSFGCTENGGTGIGACQPGQCEAHSYIKALPMGDTALGPGDVLQLLNHLAEEWQGADYDLLRCNCCHFASEFCRQLGVDPLPGWVLNLAEAGAALDDGLYHVRSTASKVSAQSESKQGKSSRIRSAISKVTSKMTGTMKSIRSGSMEAALSTPRSLRSDGAWSKFT